LVSQGGNERNNIFAISLELGIDQGLFKNTYLKRYSGKVSVDDQIKNMVKDWWLFELLINQTGILADTMTSANDRNG